MAAMTEIEFPCWTVCQILDNRLLLAEPLGFAEFARLSGSRERLRKDLSRNLKRLIETTQPAELYRRQVGGVPSVAELKITLEPSGSKVWREPLPLVFPVVYWSHPGGAAIAFVPALGIEVVAHRAAQLPEQLEAEVRLALDRAEGLTLPRLAAWQQGKTVHVERLLVPVRIKSAKARELAAERAEAKTTSVLPQVATDLTEGPAPAALGLETIVGRLAELLLARSPRSILLVGPAGVGKTAAVRELVRRRSGLGLGQTPFWTTSGARLVAGMSGYGMWQERCQKVVREAAKRKAILHLGNLVELMEVGKSEYNTTGIAAFLRPYLARGELLAIAECTPEQLPLIEREDPHLLAVLQVVQVHEPDLAQGREILRHAADQSLRGTDRSLAAEALDRLDRLHRRYATYSAYPGRPLRFLQNLVSDCRENRTVTGEDVLNAFTRETGLPRVLLDPAARLDLTDTRRWFDERVLGQPEAVELVVDLLATTKAALTRPRKPIASLLFIGPTGVGKTEMAKALAEFLFGSRRRLTRFDMSEFGDAVSVQRLIGGMFGSEGLLTARVREQPFSVILLDEFEKADALFLDLLLQILGEGRLTDAAGRLADFSNAVVILTSNLGAESFQLGGFGFAKEGSDSAAARREFARAHFERAVQEHLRPELFNRIDRLVPFAPLEADTIHRIALRHLERVQVRDGIHYRGVSLQLGDGVAAHLARIGFDARYGARPLVRALERELLAPLAEAMNHYGVETALEANVNVAERVLQIGVKARTNDQGQPLRLGAVTSPLAEIVQRCVALRRKVQALERSTCVRELANDQFQLEKEEKRFEKTVRRYLAKLAALGDRNDERRGRLLNADPRQGGTNQMRRVRLARLREITDQLRELSQVSAAVESEGLLEIYSGSGKATLDSLTAGIVPLEAALHDLLLTLYSRQFEEETRNALTLAIFGEDEHFLRELTLAYLTVAERQRIRFEVMAYYPPGSGKTSKKVDLPEDVDEAAWENEQGVCCWQEDTLRCWKKGGHCWELLRRERVKDLRTFPWRTIVGFGIQMRGKAAGLRFQAEAGLHVLRRPSESQPGKCLIDTSAQPLSEYLPPAGIARRGAVGSQPRRRLYNQVLEAVEDVRLESKLKWQNRALDEVLEEAVEKCLEQQLQSLLNE